MALSAVGELGGEAFFDRFSGWESVQSDCESNIAAIDGSDAHVLDMWGVDACGGGGVAPMTSAIDGDKFEDKVGGHGGHGDRRVCCT